MLKFRAFGIPIFVQPAFWLTALLLGGGIGNPTLLILWIVVVFVSVLVHELGHVAAMRVTGGSGQIVLTAFGGLAIPDVPREQSRAHSIFISAAGPLAQIGFGIAIAALVVATGSGVAIVQSNWGLPSLRLTTSAAGGPVYFYQAINFLLYISFFWALLNLAPVYPLDGGQIMRAFVGLKPALIVSLIIAVAISLLAFTNGLLFAGILFGWMAFSNVQTLREA